MLPGEMASRSSATCASRREAAPNRLELVGVGTWIGRVTIDVLIVGAGAFVIVVTARPVMSRLSQLRFQASHAIPATKARQTKTAVRLRPGRRRSGVVTRN